MSNRPLHELMGGLRKAAGPHAAAELTDTELLGRWAAQRDGAAFEVLLWRHGPTVLGLCRRLLRDGHAAEDAFQAAFLALARTAGAIKRGESVRAWLYKVAYRAALRARSEGWCWQALDPESADAAASDPTGAADRRDLREALDAELDRLPARYRVPLVLCYLEGRTNEEAARELGCPVGTVVSRLARGRQRLRGRLLRRGLAPVAALLVGTLPRDVVALPPALVAATTRVVLGGGSGVVVSAQVMALTEGVLRTMSMAKLKIVAAVLMALTVAGTGAVGQRFLKSGPGEETGDRIPRVPLKLPGSRPRPVDVQALRDAVERARANLQIKKAELNAAQAALQFAKTQLARFQQLARVKAIDARLVEEKEADVATRQATLQIRAAELNLAEVQVAQAQRMLEAAAPTAPPRLPPQKQIGRPSTEQRLRELEKRFDELRRDFDQLKSQLRRSSLPATR